jgi:hypothetical protein
MCQIIMCAKCLKIRESSKHHLLPRRFFGSNENSPLLFLCRDCHTALEKLIPQHHKLERDEYFLIAVEFLRESAQQYGKVLQFVHRRKR